MVVFETSNCFILNLFMLLTRTTGCDVIAEALSVDAFVTEANHVCLHFFFAQNERIRGFLRERISVNCSFLLTV